MAQEHYSQKHTRTRVEEIYGGIEDGVSPPRSMRRISAGYICVLNTPVTNNT